MATTATPLRIHPGLLDHAEQRRRSLQNRIADAITSFAGSMWFVYIHILWFSVWILAGIERYPYGLLTMIVSLEAIFLSTFVMISQNRQDQARGHISAQQYALVKTEKDQNEELIRLSHQILELTRSIEALTKAHTGRS